MRRSASWWLFWVSVGTIIYTYIGFPVLTALRALLFPRAVKRATITPSVSIIIVAHNEADVIVRKLDNTMALDYPNDLIEVIVASDGSDDGMNELVATYPTNNVRLLALPRQGKNLTLNAAVSEAHGEILVFSDADSMLDRDAIQHLVAPFADPTVGGVGGDYRYASSKGSGERTYWDFDRFLKEWQSRAGSMTSATGQIYAVRRRLSTPVPMGVTDDSFTSIQVVGAHRRLVFEAQAIARGPEAASAKAEFGRKVRVMTRGLRSVWLSRYLLNPFNYGYYAIQLFSHKVLRRMAALPLIGMLISAPLLWNRGLIYRIATLAQAALHGAALLGFLLKDTKLGRTKLLSLPFFFDMVNIAALIALTNMLRGKRQDIWVTQRATDESSQMTRTGL